MKQIKPSVMEKVIKGMARTAGSLAKSVDPLTISIMDLLIVGVIFCNRSSCNEDEDGLRV